MAEFSTMRQARTLLTIATPGAGVLEITRDVAAWVRGTDIREGILTVFIQHTSASLVVQENADPDVRHDLQTFFRKLVAEDQSLYRHSSEGPDDMPAHIRSALTATSLSVPVVNGSLGLGTWQGIFIFEHRHQPQERRLVLHLLGE